VKRACSDARESTVIVDVRDTDFKGGNIRGALNIPSEHFYNDAQVDDLVERFAQSQYVVFHCMFSQQRVSGYTTLAGKGAVVRHARMCDALAMGLRG